MTKVTIGLITGIVLTVLVGFLIGRADMHKNGVDEYNDLIESSDNFHEALDNIKKEINE